MLLQLQELNAALEAATALFPFFSKVVAAIEGLAPHAPGPTKLDAAMSTVQGALVAVNTDVSAVAQITAMAPSLIGLAKAQYNANLAASKVISYVVGSNGGASGAGGGGGPVGNGGTQ